MTAEMVLKNILVSVLGLKVRPVEISLNDGLLGVIPEFDSLAVVTVVEAIEDQFDITIDDDEIDAEVFETVGILLAFVEQKLS